MLEELFGFGSARVPSTASEMWQYGGLNRLFLSGVVASSLFVSVCNLLWRHPTRFVRSLSCRSIVSFMAGSPSYLFKYNTFGGSERGHDLYGFEPWHFYVFNLLLNFNVLVPLALVSLPSLT